MKVTCPKDQYYRSQINWLDSEHKFLSTDIAVHSCNVAGSEISRQILRPAGADFAVVYGSSTDEKPVTINRISLRTGE